jgi:DNA modification methylase
VTDPVIIGNATLYLGDARDIVPTLGPIEVLITDPPYGMGFQSNHRESQHDKIQNDDTLDLLLWACGLQASHSRYIFSRWDTLRDCPPPKSCVTWVKNNWSMGDLEHEHARQTEVAMFWPGPDHSWPGKRPTDVVHAPRTGNGEHPTEKPVYLMEQVLGWTRGKVLDPFMGSGTTGVACANWDREFVGIEIDQKHFSTACRRIEDAQRQERLFA